MSHQGHFQQKFSLGEVREVPKHMGNGKAMVLIGVEDRHLNYGNEE